MCVYTGKVKKQKYNKHNVHIWLPARKLLESFDDAYIENNDQLILEIIKNIYGNYKRFLIHVLNNENEKNLTQIFALLKEEKIKADDAEEKDSEEALISNIRPSSAGAKCPFDLLSTASITNICSFLNKRDIRKFKLTSSTMAIQCLLEMKKYQNIGVFNMNLMHSHYKYRHLSYFSSYTASDLFTFHRYCDFPTFTQELTTTYNIPRQHMLTLHCTEYQHRRRKRKQKIRKSARFSNLRVTESLSWLWDISLDKLRPIEDVKTYLLLIDDRNTPIMNEQGTLCATSSPKSSLFVLIWLYYFDVKHQKLQYATPLIIRSVNASVKSLCFCIEHNIKYFLKNVMSEEDIAEIMDCMQAFRSILGSQIAIYFETSEELGAGTIIDLDKTIIDMNRTMIFKINNLQYVRIWTRFYQNKLNEQFHDNPKDLICDIRKKLAVKREEENYVDESIEAQQHYKLDAMSPSAIEHICCYLNQSDISNFKLLCSSIAIICFKEMRKHSFASINMSKLLMNTAFDDLNTHESANQFIKCKDINRYNPLNADSVHCELSSNYSSISVDDIVVFKAKCYVNESFLVTLIQSVEHVPISRISLHLNDKQQSDNDDDGQDTIAKTNTSDDLFDSFDPFDFKAQTQASDISDVWDTFGLSQEPAKKFTLTCDTPFDLSNWVVPEKTSEALKVTQNPIIKEDLFLIFDKKQLCPINDDKSIDNVLVNLTDDKTVKCNFILLYYFDAVLNNMEQVKLLISDDEKDTIKHLNDWISANFESLIHSNDTNSKIFESLFSSNDYLKKMKESDEESSLFKIFECSLQFNSLILTEKLSDCSLSESGGCFQIFVFQINIDHPVCENDTSLKYAHDYFPSNDKIQIHYRNDNISLSDSLKYFGCESKANDDDNLDSFCVECNVSPNTQIIALKKRIRDKLKVKIPINCIKILQNNEKLLQNNQNLANIGMYMIELDGLEKGVNGSVSFQLFDDGTDGQNVLIDLDLYEAYNGNQPELNTMFAPKTSLCSIPYNKTSTFSEFMQSLSNGIYKEKLEKFSNYLTNDKTKLYLLGFEPGCYCFSHSTHELTFNSAKTKLELFALDIDDDDDDDDEKDDDILLWVRFVDGDKCKLMKKSSRNFKGRPQKIGINKQMTVNGIREKYKKSVDDVAVKMDFFVSSTKEKSSEPFPKNAILYDHLFEDGVQTQILHVMIHVFFA